MEYFQKKFSLVPKLKKMSLFTLQSWKSKFMEIIKQGFKTLLQNSDNRVSEWCLMSHLSEQVAEITSSTYSLMLKLKSFSETDQPLLEVIGLSGLPHIKESLEKVQLQAPDKLIFKTVGSHALFVQAFLEKRTIICNSLPPRTNDKPLVHPDMENALCLPLVFGYDTVGVLVLANKEGGYYEEMVPILSYLGNSLAHLIMLYEHELQHSESLNESHFVNSDNQFDNLINPLLGESELFKSAELSLALFRELEEGIIVVNRELHVVALNMSAKELFGVSFPPYIGNITTNPIHICDLIPNTVWSEVDRKHCLGVWFKVKTIANCNSRRRYTKDS